MDVDTVEVGYLEAHLREGHMKCLLEERAVLRLVADDDELHRRIIVRQNREARAVVLERELARALVRRELRRQLAILCRRLVRLRQDLSRRLNLDFRRALCDIIGAIAVRPPIP